MRWFERVVPFVSVAFALSCSDPVALRESTPLELAESRWATRPFRAYTYETFTSCFCGAPLTLWCRVEVNRDTITKVSEIASGDPVHASDLRYFDTIEERFAMIRTLMEKEYVAELTVVYDSLYGYPTEIHVASKPTVTDLGMDSYAQNLRPVR